ncbi:MAG: hypothetical protein H6529_06295 [Nocardioides sp.]|nr:hypothetical protein [Nocardioidaceae bacterium]MCB8956078.1 hypothetical protein [Nocardioides sp.]
MQAFFLILASMLVGGSVATFTVVGLVNSQTAPPDQSPASVSDPTLDYGTTN